MSSESELDLRCKIAAARLELVEELRWPIAILAAAVAQLYLHSWWITLPVGVLIFFLLPKSYDREYELAWDEYERATGTGKYYVERPVDPS